LHPVSRSAAKKSFFMLAGILLGCAPAHDFVLETTHGTIHCELDAAKSPHAVAMVERTDYRNRAFFRTIPGVLVQTGSPTDDGSNGTQPRIAVEPHEDDTARLAKPGVLLLARYTPPPNRIDPDPPRAGKVIGPQLVIALGDMTHLASQVTVIGNCRDLDVVARISNTKTARVR
jgi:cyclophilin family peptidyl-prolyl cis-trans isomerase